MTKLKNWRIETVDGVCHLTLDKPGGSQNVLSAEVIAELDLSLTEIEQANPAALIIRSAKQNGFIAGADIAEFSAIESGQQAAKMLAFAHRVMNRLESLNMPSVALINGHCLGGGLELALACDYRVVCDEPSIRLGLPEVMLGIHPGFGGTVRLIETIGVAAAMALMLSGRTVTPKTAKRIGIVDLAVPLRQLQRSARHLLANKPPPRRVKGWKKLLNTAPAREILAKTLRKKVAARANPAHYPAPYRLIELWRQHGGNREDMLRAEQASVADLITTATSRNLVKVFFLREALKKTGAGGAGGPGGNNDPFNHIHIVGAGIMGTDIAAWCALRGLNATLHDQNPAALAVATRRASELFHRKLNSRRLIQQAMDRFQPDPAGYGARHADVIIEAIIENADAKIGVFSELQKTARPDALLATNTSSIPLEILCNALSAPGRLVGLHFFNPVAKMQLVEIVSGDKTYEKAAKRAAAFAARIGRLPVPVKSHPGFLVNRILMPYLLEAVELLREGVPATVIDRTATEFGMPVGPIALADTVGLDICLHVAQNLIERYGGELPAALQEKVEAGKLGKKSGQGFYKWTKGKPQKSRSASRTKIPADIEDRLIFRFLNEAVACLHEGIVEQAEQLDAGLVFGAGFAPFRGGPLHYLIEQGQHNMLRKLTALHETHGDRFKPGAGWEKLRPGEAPTGVG